MNKILFLFIMFLAASPVSATQISTAGIADGAVTDAKITSVSMTKVISGSGSYFSYKPNNIECVDGEFLTWVAATDRWVCGTAGGSSDLSITYAKATASGNVTISNPGTSTFDGVSFSMNERLFLQDQNLPEENGIYIFDTSSTPLVRASDWNTAGEFSAGRSVFVINGTLFSSNLFTLTENVATLGTDPASFAIRGPDFSKLLFDLYPQSSGNRNLGGSGQQWNNGWIQELKSNELFAIDTTLQISGNGYDISMFTDAVGGSSNSEPIQIASGASFNGDSGNIHLKVPTPNGSGNQGKVSISASHLALSDDDAVIAIPLLLYDADNSNYTGLKAANITTSTVIYSLPPTDGTSGQVLSTNGSGILSWTSSGGGGANQTLSNLTDPTAVSENLNMAAGRTLKVKNDVPIVGRDFADTTDIFLIKTNANDRVQLGNSSYNTEIYAGSGFASIISGGQVNFYAGNAQVNILSNGSGAPAVRFHDDDSSNFVGLKSAGVLTTSTIWTLPSLDGSQYQVITTDAAGTLSFSDKYDLDLTITAGGTTTVQTIDKPAGRINIAATESSKVVNDSLVDTSTLIFAEAQTNDATCSVKNIVPTAGSFTITMTAACTAETAIAFHIIK